MQLSGKLIRTNIIKHLIRQLKLKFVNEKGRVLLLSFDFVGHVTGFVAFDADA